MAARVKRTPAPWRVAPVDADRWQDCEALFAARGSPHYCWCSIYRFDRAHTFSKVEKRSALSRLVQSGTPIGVLAYAGDEPIGWCSAAPRESYLKLARSRTMPRVS